MTLAVLEVYGPSRQIRGLRARTSFRPHVAGSQFIRWMYRRRAALTR
jgi:hypothetical protein